jgi:hypothetical protein
VRDAGTFVKGVYGGAYNTAGAPVLIVADSATDNVAVDGEVIDRLVANSQMAKSATILIPFLATLSATETVSFLVTIKDSADGSSFGAATTLQASTVAATGEGGGSNEGGLVEINLSLDSYRRYVKVQVTCDLSQADIPEVVEPPTPAVEATDTATWACAVVLGGFSRFPV